MYFQIQSIPTPIMFLKHGGQDIVDYGQSRLALDSFVAIFSQSVTVNELTTPSAFGLDSLIVNGKQPLPVSDSGSSNFALQTFVAVLPQTNSQADSALSNFALQTFVAVTPQSTSATETLGVASGFALQSMVV